MHSSHRIFLTRNRPYLGNGLIYEYTSAGTKNRKFIFYPMAPCNDLGWPIHKYTKFLSRDAMLARYKLCYGPVFVRPSVWLGAEGPRDAKSCRETRVATSSLTRPIATDAQQWRGRSIHAAYCYRRAAVTWSVHPCGLLLQTRSCGAFGPSTRSVAIGSMVEQPGGQRTGFALLF